MAYTDMFEIVDDKGAIYSGSESEIKTIWDQILDGEYEKYISEHTGDLKLIQVQDVWNG